MPRQIFDDDEPLLDYNAIDELSELGMGDRGYAEIYPPSGSNEVFGDQFERRARELQRQPAGTQPVQIITAKSGPWSGNNQLGIQQEFAPASNNQQTILKLDEWGMPEVWTVSLGMDYSNVNFDEAGYFDVTAKIVFGSGGTTQTVEMDWLNGNSIALPMNAINVIAQYNGSLSGLDSGNFHAPSPPEGLRLSVILSRGNLTRTRPTRSFLGLSTQFSFISIPPFATEVMFSPLQAAGSNAIMTAIYGNGGGGANSELLFLANKPDAVTPLVLERVRMEQTISYIDLAANTYGRPVPITIPAYARSVGYISTGAGNNIPFAWQFFLSV